MDNVTEADKLGPQVLDDLFKSMPFTRRGIAIGIANQTSHKWSGMNAYFSSGKPGPSSLPEFVEKDEAALFTATKTTGLPRGTRP